MKATYLQLYICRTNMPVGVLLTHICQKHVAESGHLSLGG
jgi:hypothetical protein